VSETGVETVSRRSVARRIAGAAATVVLLAVTLVVGTRLDTWAGPREGRYRPFQVTGRMGQTVDARWFDLTVRGIRGAGVVQYFGKPRTTGGVWVLVAVRLTARAEPSRIWFAAVEDARGRTFRPSDRVDQPLVTLGGASQPGIPIEGEIVFELPRDTAGGLSLLVSGAPAGDTRMDVEARIPLPRIARATVDAWAATRTPVEPLGGST
jgi:hypothetical protein